MKRKQIKRDTGVIGLIFQRGLLDNLKKTIFIKNSRNRKKWDAKDTSPNYLQKKIFIRNTRNRKKWDAKETSPNYAQKKTFL